MRIPRVRLRMSRALSVGCILTLVVSTLSALGAATAAHASITNTRADGPDTLELAGSGWMGGNGVDVYSNGAHVLSDWCTPNGTPDCNNYVTPPSGGTAIYAGYKWQCVELINRLYISKG